MLQFMGSQRVEHDLSTEQQQQRDYRRWGPREGNRSDNVQAGLRAGL